MRLNSHPRVLCRKKNIPPKREPISVSKKDPTSQITLKKRSAVQMEVPRWICSNFQDVFYESREQRFVLKIYHMLKSIVLVLANNAAHHVCTGW